MRKLAHCDAPFDCTDCVKYDLCKKRARTRKFKRHARLAIFYVLYPFAWMIDFICKIFTSKTGVAFAIIAIVFALGLSGFKASGDDESGTVKVYAAGLEVTESPVITDEPFEVAALSDETASPAEDKKTLSISALENAVDQIDMEALIKARKVALRKLAEEKLAARAEAERLAQLEAEAALQAELEAEANQIHEIIFVRSQEIADEMGLLSDYDPILAMYGMRYLVTEEDFTIEGAAGLMGNVYSESKFKLNADNGSHFGVFQWDYYDRWPKISAYLEENGVSHYSRYQDYSGLTKEEQCEIFVWQLRASLHSSDAGYYSKTIENCRVDTSASSSADRWRANYEVCSGCKQQRMEYAEYTATLYHSLFD